MNQHDDIAQQVIGMSVVASNLYNFEKPIKIASNYDPNASVVLYEGDRLELLDQIPANSVQLIITSPPYNIGKKYEKRKSLDKYLKEQEATIDKAVKALSPQGSICWQVGNYVDGPEIFPLDILLYPLFMKHRLHLRNRIVWHFEHGLHCSRRFSGRYETVLWFTKTDNYKFDLDAVRVPQKYPGKKYFRGPKAGQYSCNPKGKNPGDLWIIPNVKHNHVEKTIHPCQFPVELIERFVLSMTEPGDWILDPYVGVGSTCIAALRHNRRSLGADICKEYLEIARERLEMESIGILRTRPMGMDVYKPPSNSKLSQPPETWNENEDGVLPMGNRKSD